MDKRTNNDPLRRILIVEQQVVPKWWLHVIDHFITIVRDKGEIPVVYVLNGSKKRSYELKSRLILLLNFLPLLVERILFGFSFHAFQTRQVQSRLKEKEVDLYLIDDLCEVEETELPYMLSGKALINQCFYQKVVWLNQGLGEGGIYGCLQFVLHYLIQRKPYQIGCISQSGYQVIYEHFFQTFNHNLVENINYWLWALSGGVEKVNKIHSTALRSHYSSFSGYVFFWWGSHVTNRLVWKGVPKLFSAFYIKKWGVVLQKKTDENQIFQTHQNYQMAFPDAENGWADPFLVQHKDQHYLFLEELNEQKQKGTIVVAQLDVNGGFQRIESILSESFHLSYPFVFENEGQWFMIPESAQGKCIRLYKADQFPYKWQWIKNLRVDVQAYDTTPFYYNANWWIFTVIKKGEGASSFDQLFLFYAKDLIEDQWKSHPQNPVVTDSRSARPAGKIFFRNGKMYRPSQNCLERYGHKLVMNEILQLSATHYEEQVSEEITLNSRTDVTGIHTYNANETLLVVDALFRKWSFKKKKVFTTYMMKAKFQD